MNRSLPDSFNGCSPDSGEKQIRVKYKHGRLWESGHMNGDRPLVVVAFAARMTLGLPLFLCGNTTP
jgi:hypothetical protein